MGIILNENNISLKVGAQAPTKWYVGMQQIYNAKNLTIFGWHVDPSVSDPAQAVTYLVDAVGKTPAAMGPTEFSYGDWSDAFFMPKPCMLKSDGTVAYYLDPNDYTKKTDGTASDVANVSFDGNAMMEWPLIWYKFESLEDKGYKAVEYIKSTGTQYIQTDIIPSNNTKIKLDMQFGDFREYANASTYNSYFCGVAEFGGDTTSEAFWGASFNETSDSTYFDFYLGNVSWQESATHISNPANITTRQIMQICRGNSYWGNQTAPVDATITKAEPTKPLAIMGFNCVDRPNFSPNPYKCRNLIIYGAMIYLNGSELSHNLIPVERISDNELGLYDIITNKFYSNAGTGTFEKGSYVDGHGFFYCSPVRVDSSYKCWCNLDCNGSIIPHFYTAMYNGTGTSKLRSISGVQLTQANGSGNLTMQEEINRAKANNTSASVEWFTDVYCDRILIDALLILLGKSLNTQKVFGKGIITGGQNSKQAYVTGSLNDKGMFYGDIEGTTSAVKVFGMENWWGCVLRSTAGLIGISNGFAYKLTYSMADGTTVNGYSTSSTGYLTKSATKPSGGYITKMVYGNHGFYPISTTGGTNSTYYCDQTFIGQGYARFGGAADYTTGCGAVMVNTDIADHSTSWAFSAALSCKPLKT